MDRRSLVKHVGMAGVLAAGVAPAVRSQEVLRWRERDPIDLFASRLVEAGVVTPSDREAIDAHAQAAVDRAVEFAEASPFPAPESLYDDVYVLGQQVQGWYSVDERSPGVHRGEDERAMADASASER